MTAATKSKSSSKKSTKGAPDAKERLRKAAMKEIQERLDKAEQPEATAPATAPAPQAGEPKQAAKSDGTRVAKLAKPAKGEGGPKQLGGLDAAAIVLKAASGPLTCKEIWAKIDEKKLWFTEGRTPEATIYSAMIREIAAKKGESRFRKAARGKFEYCGKEA